MKTLKTWTTRHFALFAQGYGGFMPTLYIFTSRNAIFEVYACDGSCAAN